MERIFKLSKEGFTKGKKYIICGISYSNGYEFYHTYNDNGQYVRDYSRLFRDFSIEEIRDKKLKELGI